MNPTTTTSDEEKSGLEQKKEVLEKKLENHPKDDVRGIARIKQHLKEVTDALVAEKKTAARPAQPA